MLATNVGCLRPGLMLPQNPDDLLFREPARFHVHPPSEVMDSTQIRRSFRGSGHWLAGTIGGAVLQAWLIDVGVVSEIDPPWIITIGSSFIGFFAGAYAAIKLGNLALRKNNRFGS